MQFFQHFWIGIRSYFDAWKFIRAHKLYWYFLIPAALMLLIYALGAYIKGLYPSPVVSNMNDMVWYFITLLLNLSAALLLMKFAKYLVVILLSPLLSHLSQKSEKILTGTTYAFNFTLLISDVKRGIRIAIRNIMWEYFFFLIILLVSYFGWDDPMESPIFYLTFAIGFFYYGFSFLDYINERRRLDMDESIQFIRHHRGLAISIGLIYSLLILVPVDLSQLFSFSNFTTSPFNALGMWLLHLLLWAAASFAPILAIVAATLSMHKTVGLGPIR